MNKYVHLQLARKDIPTKIDVVQYATKPDIVFVLDDYTPSLGAVVSLYIEKPDGTKVFNYCSLSENEVTYTPTTQSFPIVGVSICQLQIIESDGTAVSFPIVAIVEKNIVDSSAIESQDEFTALEEALQTVSDYDGRITQNTNRLDNLGDEHVTFEEAQTDETISDNLTLSTIFGRIKRLFTRVKTVEDKYVIKNTNYTSSVSVGSGNITAGNTERVQTWVTNTNDEPFAGIFRDEAIGLWQDGSVGWKWHILTKPKSLKITRTENTYFNATSVGYLYAYEQAGILFLMLNLIPSTALPANTALFEIGRISGWNAKASISVILAAQNGQGTLLVSISSNGVIQVGNYSGQTVNAFCRNTVVVPKA